MHRAVVLSVCLTALAAHADEGMWTYDNFPSTVVKERYGFAPDAQWLERVRLSSARLAGGCSASFVSKEGLVMTNHHVATDCIQKISSEGEDLIKCKRVSNPH